MTIRAGTHLGPYRIEALVGQGGMGEVYRGLDTRLNRAVAIKVLPSHLSADPQLRERFAREARSISLLNHPHICTLHDVGSHDGVDYLVMEFLEGESLAARLSRGPLPLPEVLRYGAQIAEALHVAHRAGVVHRDLKPGNIIITKGNAKLLDFGLAKTAASGPAITADAPTQQQEKPLTTEGAVLGTFQYMAPEQVAGEEADVRTDIFALGMVLYEMSTGQRAFDGRSRTSLVAAIVGGQPRPISELQPLTPWLLEQLIATCLAKEPDARWQSAHDVALQLQALNDSRSDWKDGATATQRRRRAMALIAAFLAVAGLAAYLALRRPEREDPLRVQSSITAPKESEFWLGGPASGSLTISPDNRYLTFAGPGPDHVGRIWLRDLQSGQSRAIAGTDSGEYPFWSPDSRQIAFFAKGKLRTIPVAGGSAIDVCAVLEPRGGSWGRDGFIVMAPHWRGPIQKVAASGGVPVAITTLDESANETTHRWPTFLPDGKHFLYLAASHLSDTTSANNVVYVASIEGGMPRRLVLRARSNAFYAAGHLLYVREQTLVAQRFDLNSFEVQGDAVSVVDHVRYEKGFFQGVFAASDRLLLYQTGTSTNSRLVWFDRAGSSLGVAAESDDYFQVALAPNQQHAAVSIGDPSDVWLLDLQRKVRTRFTTNPWEENQPRWAPDGKSLLYWNNRAVQVDAYRRAIGSASEEAIATDPKVHERPVDWSRDGRTLLLAKAPIEDVTNYDLWLHALDTASPPSAWMQTPFNEWDGRFSPDGAMIAFVSNESGRDEVYVATIGDPAGKIRVSSDGGMAPRWRGDARELFYVTPDGRIIAAPILSSSPLRAAAETVLFDANIVIDPEPCYDVTADGQRFLINQLEQPVEDSLTLVTNWTSALPKH